jgi:hypothetical protein
MNCHRFNLACLILALYCCASCSIRAQSQSAPKAMAAPQNEQSQLRFTVIDHELHFVSTLRVEDLRLLVDNQPQEVTALGKLADQPLTVAILIDSSISQEKTLPNQKAAAAAFVQEVLKQGKDQAEVITFTGEVTVEQGVTEDLDRVQRAITNIKFVRPPGYVGSGIVVSGNPGTQRAPSMPHASADN